MGIIVQPKVEKMAWEQHGDDASPLLISAGMANSPKHVVSLNDETADALRIEAESALGADAALPVTLRGDQRMMITPLAFDAFRQAFPQAKIVQPGERIAPPSPESLQWQEGNHGTLISAGTYPMNGRHVPMTREVREVLEAVLRHELGDSVQPAVRGGQNCLMILPDAAEEFRNLYQHAEIAPQQMEVQQGRW